MNNALFSKNKVNNVVSLYKSGIGNFSISCVILLKSKGQQFLELERGCDHEWVQFLEGCQPDTKRGEHLKFLWKFLRWHCDCIVMQTTSSQVSFSVKDQQKWEMK